MDNQPFGLMEVDEIIIKVEPIYFDKEDGPSNDGGNDAGEANSLVDDIYRSSLTKPISSIPETSVINNSFPNSSKTSTSIENSTAKKLSSAKKPKSSIPKQNGTKPRTKMCLQTKVTRGAGKVNVINTPNESKRTRKKSAKVKDPNSCELTDSGNEGKSEQSVDPIVKESTDDTVKQAKKEDETFACEACHRRCVSKQALAKHVDRHRKILPCPECGKRFRFVNELTRHTMAHTGEKAFICEVCGRGFSEKSKFRLHGLIHMGIRQHCCQYCPAKFTFKEALVTHIRIHTGEKPYACDLCDKVFARRDYLQTHKRWHRGDRNFPCSVCDKHLTTRNHLKNHMMVHTRERPHGCEWCGSRFSRASGLKRHKATVHAQMLSDYTTEPDGAV